jgi:hypothetical protein
VLRGADLWFNKNFCAVDFAKLFTLRHSPRFIFLRISDTNVFGCVAQHFDQWHSQQPATAPKENPK